jgi:hypothetical protein
MQKHVLLNVTGVAALSLLCACGSFSEKKEESKPAVQEQASETKKEALAEIPADVEQAADVATQAVAQAEEATKVATNEGEQPKEEAGSECPAPETKA